MKLVLALLATLVLAPAAAGESILFATDRVAVPVRLVTVAVAGGPARVARVGRVLDVSADGRHVVGADGRDLLYDGAPIARAAWEIDDARIAPDGTRIAFTAISEAHCGPAATKCATWELWLVRTDGSRLHEVTPNGRYPRFSPDGKKLAFLGGFSPADEGGNAVIERLADGRRTWLTFADDAAPGWAPDSSRIVYTSNGRIRIGASEPRRVRTLAHVSGWAPRFSPDGGSIAYLSGPSGLVVLHLGGAPRVVAHDAIGGVPPAWSQSGWLVYVAGSTDPPPPNMQLARVRPDGSGRRALTRFMATTYVDDLWVRGGTAYAGTTFSRYLLSSIEAVDPAGGAVEVRARDPRADDVSPTVAPDGSLAYAHGATDRFGWFCLFVRDRCVTTPTSVEGVSQPVWSPDGGRLAFLERAGAGIALWVADADGTNRQELVPSGAFIDSPSWSPDGRTIVFSSNRSGPAADANPHLWTVDVATGALRQLDTGTVGLTPSWSPDGRSIVYLGGTWGGPYDLDLLDVATGARTTVTRYGDAPASARPAWSPDSVRIAYRAADGSLHVVGRDGSADRQLVTWTTPGSTLAWAR